MVLHYVWCAWGELGRRQSTSLNFEPLPPEKTKCLIYDILVPKAKEYKYLSSLNDRFYLFQPMVH